MKTVLKTTSALLLALAGGGILALGCSDERPCASPDGTPLDKQVETWVQSYNKAISLPTQALLKVGSSEYQRQDCNRLLGLVRNMTEDIQAEAPDRDLDQHKTKVHRALEAGSVACVENRISEASQKFRAGIFAILTIEEILRDRYYCKSPPEVRLLSAPYQKEMREWCLEATGFAMLLTQTLGRLEILEESLEDAEVELSDKGGLTRIWSEVYDLRIEYQEQRVVTQRKEINTVLNEVRRILARDNSEEFLQRHQRYLDSVADALNKIGGILSEIEDLCLKMKVYVGNADQLTHAPSLVAADALKALAPNLAELATRCGDSIDAKSTPHYRDLVSTLKMEIQDLRSLVLERQGVAGCGDFTT